MGNSLLKDHKQIMYVIVAISFFMLLISLALAQSSSPSPLPSVSPSVSPTATPEPSPSSTASPTCCACPSPSPAVSPIPKPSPTVSPKPSPTTSPTVSPTPFVIPKPKGEPIIKITSVCSSAFIRGDANSDGKADISDSIHLSYALQGKYVLACQDAADVNDDEIINSKDYEYLLSYLFEGGSSPKKPFPVAGMDEACDSRDNDLDGNIDEGCPQAKIEEKVVQSCSSSYKRGDANSDGEVDVSDSVYISMYLRGEAILACQNAADANADGKVTVDDAKYLLAYLFEGGPKPPAPSDISSRPQRDSSPSSSPVTSLSPTTSSSPSPTPRGILGRLANFWKNLFG